MFHKQFYVRHIMVWQKWKSCRTCQSFDWFVCQVLWLTTTLGQLNRSCDMWKCTHYFMLLVPANISSLTVWTVRSRWQNPAVHYERALGCQRNVASVTMTSKGKKNEVIYLSRLMTKPTVWLCAQQRLRSAWASAQSDQSLRCALNG